MKKILSVLFAAACAHPLKRTFHCLSDFAADQADEVICGLQ